MNSVRHWFAALIAASCGLVLSACASTVSGTATSPSLETDDLTAMLLSVEEVRRIVGTADLETRETYDDVLAYAEASPGPCSGVPFNTLVPAYRDSGYEAVTIWRECAGTRLRAVPDEDNDQQFWTIGDTGGLCVLAGDDGQC